MSDNGLSRRGFLYGTAVAAATATLVACTGNTNPGTQNPTSSGAASTGKGSEKEPLEPPATFQEAPALAAQVKAGKLPPVAERLPEKPYVVPHKWLAPGKYGGTMLMPGNEGVDVTQKEFMYGHSPLRWLNDGLDFGPGLAESWESNDDQSEWTLHFRKGLKWSDGHPWTTEDVMFWWEDMVLNEEFAEGIPDEARSGKGTVAKVTAPDDLTIVLTYDAPSPMVPEIIANWVKRGIGAGWMEPKHYVKQFHPKYNKNVPKDWPTAFDAKRNAVQNPDVPVMTGWQLAKYQESLASTYQRNPYYWVVDPDGNQLPYLDSISFTVIANVQTRKLQMQQGKFDFVHGRFAGLVLSDISGLRSTQSRSGMQMTLWDSGSGTGSIFFFNQDYYEPEMRALIRKPEYRQALSLAFNRPEARKAIYYDTGELTTGTYSPKTREFQRGDGKSLYEQWRDSFSKYDPEQAKKMLDELGVVDKNGDGMRELPSGKKLVVYLDYQAEEEPSGEHMQKNELLKKNWEEIGIETKLNPVPNAAWDATWATGKLMSRTTWETSTVSVAADMVWMLPMEPSRWAPLQGQFYAMRGTPAETEELDVDPFKRTPPRMEPEPGGPVERMWQLSDQIRVEADLLKRDKLVADLVKIHVNEGPFFMGSVANYPAIELVKNGLRNIPTRENTALGGFTNDWHYPVPAAYDPETWFWDDPSAHS
ncbi:ABC transporter substrate-binding protein [Tenggerimyces flavus]|uniref:ABC transporter substrate-binding protein n=1 Tax=Tenggerimyces flavus TaxID=1708749 RepID=A0ABV7YGH4_9ACTN|nr:ABC transporter substrate-binding protein [Tenggerimyces flavus]MBM7789233.1 peptide/nickel transport system substrate-binding protein [Tenggerimyces flavus]